MKIIVLAGGLSTERDVSLTSGAGICKALLAKGHDVHLMDVYLGFPYDESRLDEVFFLPEHGLELTQTIHTQEPDIAAVKAQRGDQSACFFGPNVIELCRLADITFLGLHGGEGESGKVQAAFDLLGIRYTGPGALGCAFAMDKDIAKQVLLQSGVETPHGFRQIKNDPVQSVTDSGLAYPVVVKTCMGGSSIGVFIVHSDAEYEEALQKAFVYEEEVVVEEYIEGREFSCGIIDGKSLPPIEIIPKTGFFDYANKYQAGATTEICPADISPEVSERMQMLTVRAYKALKLSVYGRADFMLDGKDRLYCLEMNTLPGMTPNSLLPQEAKAVGIAYEDLCELIIQKSMEARYRT